MAIGPEQPISVEGAMARTDAMTGLPNGRAWEEELRRELARAKRQSHDISVAFLVLDGFDVYRDAHGEAAASQLLRDAAQSWRLSLRVFDYVARLGGAKFAVLFPECAGHAPQALERLRDTTPDGVTCSAGIAIWNWLETAEQLMARTDAALGEAMEQGDRAVLSEF